MHALLSPPQEGRMSGYSPEDQQVPDEMAEADRLIKEAVQKISGHVDAVRIFATKKREGGQDGTWRLSVGYGNWYAQYGQIRDWINLTEGESARTFKVPDAE